MRPAHEPRDKSRSAQAKRDAIHRRQLRDWLNDAQAQTEYSHWSARVAVQSARAARDFSPKGAK